MMSSNAKYKVSILYVSKIMTKGKVFRYVGQRSLSRSLGHRPCCYLKGFHKLSILA